MFYVAGDVKDYDKEALPVYMTLLSDSHPIEGSVNRSFSVSLTHPVLHNFSTIQVCFPHYISVFW